MRPWDAAALRAALVGPAGPWARLDVVDRVGSTNAELLAAAAQGAPDGRCSSPSTRTRDAAGWAAQWMTPPGAGIAVSVLLRPHGVSPDRFGWLPLLTGLAVHDAVRAAVPARTCLKWPNDLLVGQRQRKAGGILAEATTGPDGTAVVLGIGLNVTGAPDDLPPGATSLAAEGGVELDRAALLVSLLTLLAAREAAWRAAGGRPGRRPPAGRLPRGLRQPRGGGAGRAARRDDRHGDGGGRRRRRAAAPARRRRAPAGDRRGRRRAPAPGGPARPDAGPRLRRPCHSAVAYPDELLVDGERVVLHRHPHWRLLVGPVLVFLLVVGAAGYLAALARGQGWQAWGWPVIATVAVLLVGVLTVAPVARWRTTHLVVTTRRLLVREGVRRGQSLDVPLDRIAAVHVRRTRLGPAGGLRVAGGRRGGRRGGVHRRPGGRRGAGAAAAGRGDDRAVDQESSDALLSRHSSASPGGARAARRPGRCPAVRRRRRAGPRGTPAISLRGLRKEFPGGVVAVADLDLDIAEGEFVTLLGPSGSGKTTVLRLIAGFEQPTAGTVALRGRDVTGVAAVRPRRAHRVPGLRAVPAPVGAAQRRVPAAHRRGRPGRAPGAGAARRWPRCGSRRWPTGRRPRCPAASASGWRWPARWSTGRPCCCSTSRSARWTSSCASRCRSSSSRSSGRPGSRSCWSPTTRTRRSRWPTGSWCSPRAGSSRPGPRTRSTSGRPRRSSPASSAPPTCSGPDLVGRDGSWSVRPEKITVGPADDAAPAGPHQHHRGGARAGLHRPDHPLRGRAGRRRPAHGAAAQRRRRRAPSPERGQPVRLSWRPEHEIRLHDPRPATRPGPANEGERHGSSDSGAVGRAGGGGRPAARRLRRRRRERRRGGGGSAPARAARGRRPTRARSAPARASCRCWPGPATPRTAPPARTPTGWARSSRPPAARSR